MSNMLKLENRNTCNATEADKETPVTTTCQAEIANGCAPSLVAINAREKVAPQISPATVISR